MRSKKYHIIFIILAFLLINLSGLGAQPIAVVLKVKGTVGLQKEGQAKGAVMKRGTRLENGDKLVTGKKSYAAVRFIDDASLLRIRSNSRCTIRGQKEQNKILKNVFLEVGTILARVTKQKGKFEVATPTSVASVKGTEWIIDQILQGGTYFYGLGGVVEITNSGGVALLHEGETGFVPDEGTAPTIRPTKPGEVPTFDDLSEGEDFFEFEFENNEGQKKLLQFRSSEVVE
jgi:hypothetical protein